MPVQSPQWSEYLSCPICYNEFEATVRCPISLGCGHTLCRHCLAKLQRKQCPFDQTAISTEINQLPVNTALLQLVAGNGGVFSSSTATSCPASSSASLLDGKAYPDSVPKDQVQHYLAAKKCIEELALYLKTSSQGSSSSGGSSQASGTSAAMPPLSRPMQRKLVTLINCQVVEGEGRARAMRAARSLGERSVTELILQHQNPAQLSANLWAAVRARGCQFLGPAMQEEVLRLVLLALEDGSALSRKVLVMFVVQRLAAQYPQASKTSIGHVVQLLYRASCFKVSKREGDSSLMQLKEEFRSYEALRREHDAQIVQIATEAGLRIAPEQWSSLLYGDAAHKSHMQSIIDKLQTPQSFSQSVQELVIALQRTGDPGNLAVLRPNLELLADIDPSPDATPPSWEDLRNNLEAARLVVKGLVEFIHNYGSNSSGGGGGRKSGGGGGSCDDRQTNNAKYKTSMCRDLTQRGSCPRGANCTFAHSHEEMERYRAKNKKNSTSLVSPTTIARPPVAASTIDSCSPPPSNGISKLVGPNTSNPLSAIVDSGFGGTLSTPDTSPPPPLTINTTYDANFLKDVSAAALNPDTPAFQPTFAAPPHKFPPAATLLCGDPILVQVPSVGLITTVDSNNKMAQTLMTNNIAALQHRKQELLAQLEKQSSTQQYYQASSHQQMVEVGTYSPWTSNNIFSYSPSAAAGCGALNSSSSDERIKTKAGFYPSEKDEFIPFGAPLVSKYGPISRTPKSSLRGGPTIQVNSAIGELTTSPTSSVRHPLPSASLAPTLYTSAVPVAIIPSDQYPSLMVPVAAALECPPPPPGTTALLTPATFVPPPEHSKLTEDPAIITPYLSELQLSSEGKTNASRRLLHEELLALERQIQENERFGSSFLEGSKPVADPLVKQPSRTVPTSIGPWPSQTLEQDLLKDLETCWTHVLDDDPPCPSTPQQN